MTCDTQHDWLKIFYKSQLSKFKKKIMRLKINLRIAEKGKFVGGMSVIPHAELHT